jgi:flagellar assembly protein FliH
MGAPVVDAPAPRVFGGQRVLRQHQFGVETPRPLSVPSIGLPSRREEAAEVTQSAPLAPDFAAIEEAAKLRGYNEGYEAGIAAGHAAAEEQMAELLGRLTQLVGNVHESHAGFFRAAERQVVDLALQIAQKVVEKEVENMPDLAVGVIRSALEEMDARTAVRVRVSPDDEELLRRRWTQAVPSGISPDKIEIQADDRVKSGGAVIETTQGQVDAQLDTKLAQLGNALWTFVMDTHSTTTDEDTVDA